MIRDMRIDQLKVINRTSTLFLDIIVEQFVYIPEQIYLSDLFDLPRDSAFPYFCDRKFPLCRLRVTTYVQWRACIVNFISLPFFLIANA